MIKSGMTENFYEHDSAMQDAWAKWFEETKLERLDPIVRATGKLLDAARLDWNTRAPAGAAPVVDAEKEFLAASVAVWREIDRLSSLPEGYKGLPPDTDPRIREQAAWERYRSILDAAATAAKACGFCGKSDQEVKVLIQAPVGYICDGCVTICASIIERAAPVEQSDDQ